MKGADLMQVGVKCLFDSIQLTIGKTSLPIRTIFHRCNTHPITKRISTKGLIAHKELMHEIKSRAYRDAH